MKKQENLKKQVLYLFGNEAEFGQALSNIIGLNPDLVIHNQFTASSIRQKPVNPLLPNEPAQIEPFIMCYLIYSNPGEIKVMPDAPPPQEENKVKANITPLVN